VDHVAVRVKDVEAATAFYSTIGAVVGLTIRRQTAERAVFSVGASDGSFLVIAGEPTENVHLAFSGDDEDVRRFHADAIAAGYRSNGEPGERPRYHPGYYADEERLFERVHMASVDHHRKPIRAEDLLRLLWNTPHVCMRCGRRPPEIKLHVDHAFPASRAGSSKYANLQFLCADCNLTKSKKLEQEALWLRSV
jgi:catechol 2,3-dioxygenase-like lactoylglutathione lyase family enzyme